MINAILLFIYFLSIINLLSVSLKLENTSLTTFENKSLNICDYLILVAYF